MTFTERLQARRAVLAAHIQTYGPDVLVCPVGDHVSPQFYAWGGACATHRRDCAAASDVLREIDAALGWAAAVQG